FHLAQISQSLLERAQLRVIERAGQLLAIARNERDRRAAVQKRHRRVDLLLPNPKLLRNFLIDVCHANSLWTAKQPNRPAARTPLMDQVGLIPQAGVRSKAHASELGDNRPGAPASVATQPAGESHRGHIKLLKQRALSGRMAIPA